MDHICTIYVLVFSYVSLRKLTNTGQTHLYCPLVVKECTNDKLLIPQVFGEKNGFLQIYFLQIKVQLNALMHSECTI